MWTTLGAHAPTLAVILVISGLLIRYFPQIAAIIFTGERRRASLEVLRLEGIDPKDRAALPSYLDPGNAPPPTANPPREE